MGKGAPGKLGLPVDEKKKAHGGIVSRKLTDQKKGLDLDSGHSDELCNDNMQLGGPGNR